MSFSQSIPHPGRLLTADELAQHLAIAKSTVRKWTIRDRLPCVRLLSRAVRYDLHEVLAWLQERNGK